MRTKMNRRKFLQMAACGTAGLLLSERAKGAVASSQESNPSRIHQFSEAPSLKAQVAEGTLAPIDQRLPSNPLVLTPIDGVQNYGGIIRTLTSSWAGGLMEETQYGHSPLRWIKDGQEIAPGMCDTWSTNPTNTEWTLHIREGLKWSDGEPVTVDDVLFWWNDLVDPNYPGGPDNVPDFGYDGMGLATFVKMDDYTLKIVYTLAAPLTGYRLAMWVKGNIGPRWIAPAHYLKQFHPKYNLNYTDFSTFMEKVLFRTNPDCPSLDPWLCTSYTPATENTPDRILWNRNPYYYAVDPTGNQLPYIDGWIEDGIDDHNTQLNQVMNGKVDFLHFNSFQLGDVPLLQSGQTIGNYNLRFWDSGSGTGMVYFWNYDHPDPKKRALYRTPEFKQAMSLALNRPAIQTDVYKGYGMLTTGTLSPKALEFNYNAEAQSRFVEYRDAYVDYDPVAAGSLLDSINVIDVNSDTWREYPDGSPLIINIDLPSNPSSDCMAVLSYALQNWQSIGLNVQVNFIEDDFSGYWNSGQGDIASNWEVGDGPNHLVYPSWMVPNEPTRWAPLCGNTFAARGTPWENTQCELSPWDRTPPRYCSTDPEYSGTPVAQIQQIYLQAEIEPDEYQRIQYVWQMLDIHKDNVFYLGTVANYPHIEIVSTNLGNVPTHDQLYLGGFVIPWIVPFPAITNPETWSYINMHKVYLPTVRR